LLYIDLNLQDYAVGTPLDEFEKKIRNLNPRTQQLYRRCLNEFCQKIETTPNKLYQYAYEWETSNERGVRGRLSLIVSDFIREKIEAGLNPNTARSYKKAINKFLSANELRPLKLDNQKKIDSKRKPMATPKHIRELFDLSSTNVRIRALLMTMKDTGLRVSDIEHLTVEDFRNSALTHDEFGREFRVWAEPVTSRKTGVNAYVHLGYEAIPWIEAYVGNRREGSIFLTKSGMKPMKSHSMTTAIKNLCKPLNSRGIKISAHSLRIFFLTTFDTNRASNTGKRIAGKRLPPTDDPYYATGENLTRDYIQVYNAERGLSIFESGQFAKTQEEIQKLRDSLEIERARFIAQQKQIEELQEWKNNIITPLTDVLNERISQVPYPGTDEDREELVSKLRSFLSWDNQASDLIQNILAYIEIGNVKEFQEYLDKRYKNK